LFPALRWRNATARGNEAILRGKKGWWLYFLPQNLAKPKRPIKYKESHIFAIFPCANNILYTEFEDIKTFVSAFMSEKSFRTLRVLGKCSSHHLFSYGGLFLSVLFPVVKYKDPEKEGVVTPFLQERYVSIC